MCFCFILKAAKQTAKERLRAEKEAVKAGLQPRESMDAEVAEVPIYARMLVHPPDPAGYFSEGGEVIQLLIEGSLTIRTSGIKRYNYRRHNNIIEKAR